MQRLFRKHQAIFWWNSHKLPDPAVDRFVVYEFFSVNYLLSFVRQTKLISIHYVFCILYRIVSRISCRPDWCSREATRRRRRPNKQYKRGPMVSAELRSNYSHRSQRSPAHGPRQRAARWFGLGTDRSVVDGLDGSRRTSDPDPDSPARRRRHLRASGHRCQNVFNVFL